ncbi:hypothetical protein BDZ89DRAFT_1046897 [Hymenopellis radicata]|nr:hypothetical protein BDZ89DRAFT_1046897 [Hymenopellis radicata]
MAPRVSRKGRELFQPTITPHLKAEKKKQLVRVDQKKRAKRALKEKQRDIRLIFYLAGNRVQTVTLQDVALRIRLFDYGIQLAMAGVAQRPSFGILHTWGLLSADETDWKRIGWHDFFDTPENIFWPIFVHAYNGPLPTRWVDDVMPYIPALIQWDNRSKTLLMWTVDEDNGQSGWRYLMIKALCTIMASDATTTVNTKKDKVDRASWSTAEKEFFKCFALDYHNHQNMARGTKKNFVRDHVLVPYVQKFRQADVDSGKVKLDILLAKLDNLFKNDYKNKWAIAIATNSFDDPNVPKAAGDPDFKRPRKTNALQEFSKNRPNVIQERTNTIKGTEKATVQHYWVALKECWETLSPEDQQGFEKMAEEVNAGMAPTLDEVYELQNYAALSIDRALRPLIGFAKGQMGKMVMAVSVIYEGAEHKVEQKHVVVAPDASWKDLPTYETLSQHKDYNAAVLSFAQEGFNRGQNCPMPSDAQLQGLVKTAESDPKVEELRRKCEEERQRVADAAKAAKDAEAARLREAALLKEREDRLSADKAAEAEQAEKDAAKPAKKIAEEEAERKKMEVETAAKKIAEEAERKRIEAETAARELADDAAAKKIAEEETERKRMEAEIAAKKIAEEAERKRIEEETAQEDRRRGGREEEERRRRLQEDAEEEAERKRMEAEMEAANSTGTTTATDDTDVTTGGAKTKRPKRATAPPPPTTRQTRSAKKSDDANSGDKRDRDDDRIRISRDIVQYVSGGRWRYRVISDSESSTQETKSNTLASRPGRGVTSNTYSVSAFILEDLRDWRRGMDILFSYPGMLTETPHGRAERSRGQNTMKKP